ncbi:MAG TPA: site-2 protease family protein [Candidatus Paceibacterota bacterium]
MDFLVILFNIIVVLFSVILHELSHGLAAHSMGDNTAKNLGRITLNPLKHLDPFGSVLLPIFTYWMGGFVFGYAKPVPYNPANLSDKKYGAAKVAIAGPLVNLMIALLFGLVLRLLPTALESTMLPQLLSFVVLINLALAIFNLMPVPPLDGHWLLLTFLPNRFHAFKEALVRYSTFIFIVFLIFIFPIIYPLIYLLFRIIVGI